jgi:hypothetical protein
MVPHRHNYRVCFFHAMACYYAVEDGLFRDQSHSQCSQKVFPNLNKIQDSAVSRKLTELIRKFIPNGVSNEVRKSFSAKSMRKGAINYMAAHHAVDYFQSHVRSGHTFGTSQEHYIDRGSLVLSIEAGKALNEYDESAFRNVQSTPPNFDMMPMAQKEDVEKYIDMLYSISDKLPHFKRRGHLRPFLRSATAVLIMSLQDMINDFGYGNKVVRKMFTVANRMGLEDPHIPEALQPGVVLLGWGKVVRTNFNRTNNYNEYPRFQLIEEMQDALNKHADTVDKGTSAERKSINEIKTLLEKMQLGTHFLTYWRRIAFRY